MANWSESENELTIAAYLAMLGLELKGEPFAKVDFYRPLSQEIGRTEGAVERKFSNISAILATAGATFIDGYKPLGNVQGLLREMVQESFAAQPELRRLMIRLAEEPPPPIDVNLGDPSPVPLDLIFPSQEGAHSRGGVFVDFSAIEAQNRERGKVGELLVLERERRHLAAVGRNDLAQMVRHVSVEDGDGLGYDVLSFSPDGVERFLEVKTTVRSARQPFYVSRNEVEFSSSEPERFVLTRVYSIAKSPGFYEMPGSLHETAQLRAESFSALPRASG